MSLAFVGYRAVTQAAAATVKTGPAKLYGVVVTASTAGTIDIYDNTSAAGTKLFSKTALALGEVIHFGGVGIAAGNGLHVVCGGTASCNILFV
jgi:hypothetical protein